MDKNQIAMNESNVIEIIDLIAFIYFGFVVLYFFVFSLASRLKRKEVKPLKPSSKKSSVVVLIPAYKEDKVIESTLKAILNQEYPKTKFEVIVISDQMKKETEERITALKAGLIPVNFENSTKAKALNYAISELAPTSFDIVAILDADNIVNEQFLSQINDAYNRGNKAIQAHRKAKNIDTEIALLDAMSEAYNNAILRKGHRAIGLSSGLVGSAMAFDFDWFQRNIKLVKSTTEDKELEILLVKDNIHVEFLEDVIVLDEKVRNVKAFQKQRRRWLAGGIVSFLTAIGDLKFIIKSRNFSYLDKLFQWGILPRLFLIFGIPFIAVVMTFKDLESGFKWWILLFVYMSTFIIALPKEFNNFNVFRASFQLPKLVFVMLLNLFKLKGVSSKFLHTEHHNDE